ncbi:MAG: phenylalanine--tRNA ligase subunit alpha [Patescibacteria group bacterium]|nr:phenylalanine--tRNA ligase subunit alpha [Patescibacteria group bacterium]
MKDQLDALRLEIERDVKAAKSLEDLEVIEVKYLGRKGELTSMLKGLANVTAEERPVLGALANQIKQDGLDLIAARREDLASSKYSALAETERVDVTEPGARPPEGHLHIMTHTIREITSIFEKIGFYRTRYPEIDWDWYAFEALNMPPEHPARDDWETFFMDAPISKKGKMVMTPHTSNGQIHELQRHNFPIRMIDIGKCYRRQVDATHTPMFHQFEGLFVDKGVNITHLRGILDYFAEQFFGPGRVSRIRPHHFRFTEPSFEVDISCGICGGTGIGADKKKCKVCKRGWLEIGGAGMVHPNVLKACGVDPKKYTGFAFGWGVERVAMMKEGAKVDDIRILYQNDVRFLKQF